MALKDLNKFTWKAQDLTWIDPKRRNALTRYNENHDAHGKFAQGGGADSASSGGAGGSAASGGLSSTELSHVSGTGPVDGVHQQTVSVELGGSTHTFTDSYTRGDITMLLTSDHAYAFHGKEKYLDSAYENILDDHFDSMTQVSDGGVAHALQPDTEMTRQSDVKRGASADADNEEHTGMMVAFLLDPATAKQVALPDGEPPEDLHCTLAYLGDVNDDTVAGTLNPAATWDVLSDVLATFAKEQSVLSGTTGGIGRFVNPEDDVNPVISLVNVPGLQDFRAWLVQTLEVAHYRVHNDYDYTPHITLAYIPKDAPLPLQSVPTVPLVFHQLCLVIRGQRWYFPLGTTAIEHADTSDVKRGASADPFPRVTTHEWRPPSHTQLALEASLSKAIKAFLDKATISTDGVTPPDDDARATLTRALTDALTDALAEGRRIATHSDERGLISAAKDLAGRAVQVVSDIVASLVEKAQGFLDALLGGGDGDAPADPAEAIAEVEAQVEAWAADYADMVAQNEVCSAIEGAVLDEAVQQGHTEKYWNNEPGACERCQQNAAASPIPIDAAWPADGSDAPPGHPRCRCNASYSAATSQKAA